MSNVRRKEYKYIPSRMARERQRRINNMMYFAQENDKRKKKKLLEKYNINIVFKENIWVHVLLFSTTMGIGNIVYHLKIKDKNRLMNELRNDMKR